MRRILYTFSFGMLAFGLFAIPATAQEKHSGKLGEYDEIVIKRKGGAKDAKVTVEIKDNEVLIDGKKLDEYKDGNIIVQRRKITPRNGNAMNNGGLQFFEDDDNDFPAITPGPAVLGVITAKKEAAGATIESVAEGSAAEKAGLREGDVITKVNDTKISEPQDLFENIGSKKPGDKVTITYLRDKKEQKAEATLDKRSAATTPRRFNYGAPPDGDNSAPFRFFMPPPQDRSPRGSFDRLFLERPPSIGLAVQDTEDNSGARVTSVKEGSAAEKAGFKKDDLITEMAGKPVKNARDVAEAYRSHQGETNVTAKGSRKGAAQNYSIKVPKNLRTENL